MPWFLAVLSGFLLFLAIPPRELPLFVWFALIPLLSAQAEAPLKKALSLAWLSGFLANLGAYYWVYEVMVSHSSLPVGVAVFLTCLMAAQQGLSLVLWVGACRAWRGRAPAWLLFSTVYVAIEFLYPTIFPLHLANCQHSSVWTSQFIDVAGPSGLTFVIVCFNLGVWEALRTRRCSFDTMVGPALLCAILLYGPWRMAQVEKQMEAAPKLQVAMVENDVGMVKSLEEALEALHRLQKLAAEAAAARPAPDLIVFPETAVKTPPPSHTVEGEVLPRGQARVYPLGLNSLDPLGDLSPLRGLSSPLLFGTVAEDEHREGPLPGRRARHNAAFLVDPQGKVLGRALKKKLLLFGEYIPGSQYFPWIYRKILTRASSLTPGEELSVLSFQSHKIGISICYEAILPGLNYELGKKKPELLINLTNDAWFGKTAEPAAHLALAKARCIELRLYMVRSTTTGLSALIDPLGRVTARSQGEGMETVAGQVGWMPGGSLFAWIGPYFAWSCVALCLIWGVQSWRASRLSTRTSPNMAAMS